MRYCNVFFNSEYKCDPDLGSLDDVIHIDAEIARDFIDWFESRCEELAKNIKTEKDSTPCDRKSTSTTCQGHLLFTS